MREITNHRVEGDVCNSQIRIQVFDESAEDGANHRYGIYGGPLIPRPTSDTLTANWCMDLRFQDGPINEAGINGITNEVLLAIVIDRLEGFQRGPLACQENKVVIAKCRTALLWLQARTRERIARGPEGTHEK